MKNIVLILAFVFFAGVTLYAQTKAEQQVEQAVAALVKAMEDGNTTALTNITAKDLTYGHSSGKVENKTEFVQAFATGASDFVKINITDQTIDIVKKTAIVRHTLDAETFDNKKPGQVKLKVMTVWQKLGGSWRLIARQAVKPPVN